MQIQEVIGRYELFVENLFRHALQAGIAVDKHKVDHLCYRTASLSEYRDVRAKLMPFGSELATTVHNGREFSIFKLARPLAVGSWYIPLIELPAPSANRPYATGLEHAEVVIAHGFTEFCKLHKDAFTHQPDMDSAHPTAAITFANKTAIKFHPMSLAEAIHLQGDRFEPVSH